MTINILKGAKLLQICELINDTFFVDNDRRTSFDKYQIFCTTWKRPNEYPPMRIHPSIAEIIVDLLLCLLIAFSIISFTTSLSIRFVDFVLDEVIVLHRLEF